MIRQNGGMGKFIFNADVHVCRLNRNTRESTCQMTMKCPETYDNGSTSIMGRKQLTAECIVMPYDAFTYSQSKRDFQTILAS